MFTDCIELELLIYALLGNILLWVGVANRLHSVKMPLRYGKTIWLTAILGGMITSLVIAATYDIRLPRPLSIWDSNTPGNNFIDRCQYFVIVVLREYWSNRYYVFPLFWCVTLGSIAASFWSQIDRHRAHRWVRSERRVRLSYLTETRHDHREEPISRILKMPGNRALSPDVTYREIEHPRLPESLDGLTILLLSDIHFIDRLPLGYYAWVVEHVNRLKPDLVLVAGDLIDRTRLIDRMTAICSRLTTSIRPRFILGNHDHSIDPLGGTNIRRGLTDANWIDIGDRWETIELRGQQFVLAGNEMPWSGHQLDLSDMPGPSTADPGPSTADPGLFRILLSHTPDVLPWAARHEFDLVLAGHLHGGQCRIPFWGPLFSPSLHGVKYARGRGLFRCGDTLLQVSRGTAGEVPLRYFCPPEILHITLRAKR